MSIQSPIPKKSTGSSTGDNPVRVLLLLRTGSREPELIECLKNLSGIELRVFYRPQQLSLEMLKNGKPPDVVLLHLDLTDAEDLTLVGALKNDHIPIVALTERASELAALKAIRAGADDVLLQPVDAGEASEVLMRVVHRAKREEDAQLGKLIAVMHSSGGAGATTIATNAACMLAANEKGASVGLLDFDIQFGNAADILDLPPNSRIEDVIDEPSRLDRAMLTDMMAKHSSGVRVLTAPKLPLPLAALAPETVSAFLSVARRSFDYVVVDLPVALESWTDLVLEQAAVIYVVCPPTVPGVHRLSQLLAVFQQEGLHDLPLRFIINRHRVLSGGADITSGQFSKAIHREVDHLIPNDYSLIAASQNQGKAAVQLKPKSNFAVAISNMIAKDLGQTVNQKKSILRALPFFGGN